MALAFVRLQFGEEVADALHGQNALQINLRVELLSGQIELGDAVILLG